MADNLPKVEIDSRRTSEQDVDLLHQNLEKLDIFNNLVATIISKDPDHYDKYVITIYADESASSILAEEVDAFSINLRKYEVDEIVTVYWKPESPYALIISGSPFGWITLTKDWEPNERDLTGFESGSTGMPVSPDKPEIKVALYAKSSYGVAYTPFKKGDTVAFYKSRFTVLFGVYQGFVWNFTQIPITTALHQVLTVVAMTTIGKFRIQWSYVRTHERVNEPNPYNYPSP